MIYIYVLRLESGKFYVGKTTNPDFRLKQHSKNVGSEWTKKYKVIDCIELFESTDDFDEDKITLKYMKEHGVDNVRGGSFSQVELDIDHSKILNKMLQTSNDLCYGCGQKGHYIATCKNQTTNIEPTIKQKSLFERILEFGYSLGEYFYYDSDDSDEEIKDIKDVSKINVISKDNIGDVKKSTLCSYCGKCDHTDLECYSKMHNEKNNKLKQMNLYSESDDTEDSAEYDPKKSAKCFYCGKYGHYQSECYSKMHNEKNTNTKKQKSINSVKCYKCGKYGHYSTTCNVK